METIVTMTQIPQIDSIKELAKFWDTHDLTDFEDELEEVTDPVFVRDGQKSAVNVYLQPQELEALRKLARDKGVDQEALVHEWVLEKLQAA